MAFYMAAIMNGASFFGRGLAGFAAGLAGLYNVLVLACLACTGLSFAWTSCTTQSEIVRLVPILFIGSGSRQIVFSCLYGFFSGFCLSLLAPAVLTLCPQPDRFGGAYVGLSALFGSFGALASGPVGGKASTSSWLLPGADRSQFITNAQRSDPANLFRTLGWFQGSLFAGAAVIYAIARLLISRDKLLV
jgi:MFS family permease